MTASPNTARFARLAAVDAPTVLVLGTGDPMEAALVNALRRYSLSVRRPGPESAVKSVLDAGPDLVLLVGDAAREEGARIIGELAENAITSVIPVAILGEGVDLDGRFRAYRHGALGVIPRSASVDEMARRICELARQVAEHEREDDGLGEATVDEVVNLLSRELRNGILSLGDGSAGSRVVLRAGRSMSDAIESFVERIRPLVEASAPISFEFHELLPASEADSTVCSASTFRERRIVVIENRPSRSDAMATELRNAGATVIVVDGEGGGLERACQLDPEIVLVDESGLEGWAYSVMRSFRAHPRLRFAGLLVHRTAESFTKDGAFDLGRIGPALEALMAPIDDIARCVSVRAAFQTRLETLGPARLLRIVARGQGTRRVTVRHARATIEIDIAEGLVAGARLSATNNTSTEGPAALAALLGLATGEVDVEPKDHPATANVMAPVDDAIAAASREHSPIAPSMVPPDGRLRASDRPKSEQETLDQLQKLVSSLEKALPQQSVRARTALAALRSSIEVRAEGSKVGPLPAAPPGEAALAAPRPKMDFKVPAPPGGPKESPNPRRASGVRPAVAVPAPARPRTLLGIPAQKLAPPAAAEIAAETTQVSPPPVAQPVPVDVAPVVAPPPVVAAPPVVAVGPPVVVTPPVVVAPVAVVAPPVVVAPPPLVAAPPPLVAAPPPLVAAAPPLVAPPPVVVAAPVAAPRPAIVDEPSVIVAPELGAVATPVVVAPAAFAEPITDEIPGLTRKRGLRWFHVAIPVATLAIAATIAVPLWLSRAPAVAATVPVATPPIAAQPAPVPVAAPVLAPTAATPQVVAPRAPVPPVAAVVAAAPVAVAPEVVAPEVVAPEAVTPEAVAPEAEADAIEADQVAVGDSADVEAAELPEPNARRGDARSHVRRGNELRRRGDHARAEQSYLAALRADRRSLRAMVGLVRVHLARHDTRSAVSWARRLVAAAPPNGGNYELLGDALTAAGDRAGAEAAYRRGRLISGHR